MRILKLVQVIIVLNYCHNDTRDDVRGRTSGTVTVILYILVTMTKRKTDSIQAIKIVIAIITVAGQ